MNPTTGLAPPQTSVQTRADGSVVVTLATDPARPQVTIEATIRHPAPFRSTLAAFLGAVVTGVPRARSLTPAFDRATPPLDGERRCVADYHQARRAVAGQLAEQNPELWRSRLPVAPIMTVSADRFVVEEFAGDQSAYAGLTVDFDELTSIHNVQHGTTSLDLPATFLGSLNQVRGAVELRSERGGRVEPIPQGDRLGPPGWLRGFVGMQAALSLPMRRITLDRGGLFGLITALGRSRTVRASRSVVVVWGPGRPATALVQPGDRPVPLHARALDVGTPGAVRLAVGRHLVGLAGLLPWVDAADLFLLGPGLPSFWSVRLGGIRLLLGLPGWTPDGRMGSLSLDPIMPPVEPGQLLTNQVTATFRDHPTQTREQVVERTRGNGPAVAACLTRLAGSGQVRPDPDTGQFHWRPAFHAPVTPLDDPEPAEIAAARAITATTSIQVTRDEVHPADGGRKVEGLILDRPVTMTVDPDGWLRRGHCTCSHQSAGRLAARGPCRHLLALQAAIQTRSGPPRPPTTLAAWFATFPATMRLD